MNRGTIIAILVVGAALAFVGRFIGRPTEPRPMPSAVPSASEQRAALPGGTATVVVYDDGTPVSDRVVVFSDEAGAVLATKKTEKDGSASGPITPRGMVTVAHGTSVRSMITITSVMPGDRLVVGEAEDEGGTAIVECRVAITVPSPFPKATKHVVSVGVNDTAASNATTPVTLAVLKRFIVDGKVRVLARALDESGRPLAYAHAFVEGCARGDGGSPATIAVRLPSWSTDFRTFTVEASSADHGTLEGSITLLPPGADAFPLTEREVPLGGEAKLDFLAPRPLGTRGKTKLEVKYEDGHDHAELEELRDEISEKTRVALAERLLPRIRDAIVDGQGTPRPSIRWSATSSLASADAIVARLAWPATREHVWTIIAPPDSPARLVVPALPDELAAWRPDARPITPAVGAVEASFWNGYADVKKSGLDSLEAPPAAPVVTIRSSVTGELEL
jgi:hypothetical protein